MKIVSRFLCFTIGILFSTSALALTPNTAFTVKLSTVSPAGQLTQAASMPVTSDTNGKVAFNFSNVPNTSTTRFLMVQIVDANSAVVRQAMVAAPAPGGNVNMGVSEVTDKQAKAMLKTMADAGNDDPTQVMMLMAMVRSGAITDADAQNFSPLARGAASAFTTFMTNNGVTTAQLATFTTNLLAAMQDFAAKMKESVDASSLTLEASKRGDAIALFMDAMVNAGANAGILANLMPIAFDEAGKAAESAAATSTINANAITAMKAAFRVETQQRQLRAEMRRFSDSMPVMGATATQTQQFASANTNLGNAILVAQEQFEQMFADPTVFPNATTVNSTETTMLTAMQTLFSNFISRDAAASSTDISSMQSTMATRMSSMGGMMGGMTAGTLAGMGIGTMVTTPGGTPQNWTVMMVSVNNFVVPTVQMSYTPSTTTLSSQLTALGVTPPTPPVFSQFSDPYKSMLELQYDLTLDKLISLQQLAQIGAIPTQAQLVQIKEAALATRTTFRRNIAGITDTQKDAMMATLAQPEML